MKVDRMINFHIDMAKIKIITARILFWLLFIVWIEIID